MIRPLRPPVRLQLQPGAWLQLPRHGHELGVFRAPGPDPDALRASTDVLFVMTCMTSYI